MTGANYLAELLGLPAEAGRPIAIALIVVLTALNVAGVRIGATTGNVLTVLKLSAIALLVVAALVLSPRADAVLPVAAVPVTLTPPPAGATPLPPWGGPRARALSFGGWQQTNAVAEELVDPARTPPKVLILGVLIVAATYLLVNMAYLRALGLEGLAASRAPAADSMQIYLGPVGRTLITFGIVTSTVGFLSMVILMSARVYQAMAADGLFFRSMAQLHPRTQTPVSALLWQEWWPWCCCCRVPTANCSTTSYSLTGSSSGAPPLRCSCCGRGMPRAVSTSRCVRPGTRSPPCCSSRRPGMW